MLDFKNPLIRKQVAEVLIKMAKKLEEDENYAKLFFNELGGPETKKKTSVKKAEKEPTPTPVKLDIYEIYQKQGTAFLETALNNLELEDLQKLVVENGLDPARKVRRWKTRTKIISHVVESVTKRMEKGTAFLNKEF
jgi:hypothetical protein